MSNQGTELSLCPGCGKIFPHEMHSKDCKFIQFKCTLCQKTFVKRKHLNQHRKIHFPSIYHCNLCSESFKSKLNLKVHLKYLHENCNKNEFCTICQATFKRKADLQVHLKIHSDKKYTCSTCKMEFHRKYNLKVHVMSCF